MLLRLKRDKLYPIRGIKKFMVEISFYMNSEGFTGNWHVEKERDISHRGKSLEEWNHGEWLATSCSKILENTLAQIRAWFWKPEWEVYND